MQGKPSYVNTGSRDVEKCRTQLEGFSLQSPSITFPTFVCRRSMASGIRWMGFPLISTCSRATSKPIYTQWGSVRKTKRLEDNMRREHGNVSSRQKNARATRTKHAACSPLTYWLPTCADLSRMVRSPRAAAFCSKSDPTRFLSSTSSVEDYLCMGSPTCAVGRGVRRPQDKPCNNCCFESHGRCMHL